MVTRFISKFSTNFFYLTWQTEVSAECLQRVIESCLPYLRAHQPNVLQEVRAVDLSMHSMICLYPHAGMPLCLPSLLAVGCWSGAFCALECALLSSSLSSSPVLLPCQSKVIRPISKIYLSRECKCKGNDLSKLLCRWMFECELLAPTNEHCYWFRPNS